MTPDTIRDPDSRTLGRRIISRIPELERESLVICLWAGALGLPILVLLARATAGYSGWMTAFIAILYAPILAIAGLILALSSRALPKDLPPTRRLWWIYLSYAVWAAGNIVGVGMVLSDTDDHNAHPSPFRDMIPYQWEFTIARIAVAVAFVGLVCALVLIARIASRHRRQNA